MKAVNIRDYKDNPKARQAMGLFKKMVYERDISQADLFIEVMQVYYEKEKDNEN